jgi:disulfide bond formation protein DsbB
MEHSASRYRVLFGAASGVSVVLIVSAILIANALRIEPCPLCILQRMVYMLVALLAAIGAVGVACKIIAALMHIVADIGLFVAGYQVWIQEFRPNITCGGRPTWWENFVDWAGNKLPSLFASGGQCADISWSLFGLSMAAWSTLAFLGLSVLSLYIIASCAETDQAKAA